MLERLLRTTWKILFPNEECVIADVLERCEGIRARSESKTEEQSRRTNLASTNRPTNRPAHQPYREQVKDYQNKMGQGQSAPVEAPKVPKSVRHNPRRGL